MRAQATGRLFAKEAGLLAGAWAVPLAFLYNFCDFVFRCGCVSAWAGAADRCNVHDAAAPHCPWCSHPAGIAGLLVLLLALDTLVFLGLRTRPALLRVFAGAAAFFLAGAAAGLGFALAYGYPHFLGFALR